MKLITEDIVISFGLPDLFKERIQQYKNDNYDDLFKDMKSLQRQIYEMQIENKKLISKNLK